MLGRRSQRDLEDEIRAHLELEAERLRAQGMSAAEAERAARRNFGNVGVTEDRFYRAQCFASRCEAVVFHHRTLVRPSLVAQRLRRLHRETAPRGAERGK